jgi:hypothetical protein
MPAATDGVSTPESGSTKADSWLRIALARRQAEDAGEYEISGARFNSFI